MRRILINGLQLGDHNTGVQYYTQNLYNEFLKRDEDHFDFQLMRSPVTDSRSLKINRFERILFENFSLPAYFRRNNFNLYHSPNYVLPYLANIPSVLTIHDLLTLDRPELCQTESALYFKFFLPPSVKKAIRIIAVSNTVKKDILNHFNLPEDKIEVIYHGVNSIFKKSTDGAILEKYHLPEKYILFVGNLEPKKNLERLIRAFDLLKRNTDIPHKLVIVGKKGWKYQSVFDTVAGLKINSEVIFTGYVPLEDLPVIHSMAGLFVFPSLYEGFGIPPLEAMACGAPVLVSDKGALPEITGGTCLQVDPFDMNRIAQGMHQLLTDTHLRNKSVRSGREWVSRFTWENAAKETLKVYEQAINKSHHSSV
jgi:glycosyltransferase involved in cell wall biosynthesis